MRKFTKEFHSGRLQIRFHHKGLWVYIYLRRGVELPKHTVGIRGEEEDSASSGGKKKRADKGSEIHYGESLGFALERWTDFRNFQLEKFTYAQQTTSVHYLKLILLKSNFFYFSRDGFI